MDLAIKNWLAARTTAQSDYWADLEMIKTKYWDALRAARSAYEAAKAVQDKESGAAADS